jgi:hypothetical protein
MGNDDDAARLAFGLPLARENLEALDAFEASFNHVRDPRGVGTVGDVSFCGRALRFLTRLMTFCTGLRKRTTSGCRRPAVNGPR